MNKKSCSGCSTKPTSENCKWCILGTQTVPVLKGYNSQGPVYEDVEKPCDICKCKECDSMALRQKYKKKVVFGPNYTVRYTDDYHSCNYWESENNDFDDPFYHSTNGFHNSNNRWNCL